MNFTSLIARYSPRPLRARRSALSVLALALALCSCVAETPSGSSSSNFLQCESDADCEDYDQQAQCSKEQICVDRHGTPIEAMEPPDGASPPTGSTETGSPDDSEPVAPPAGDCAPLEPWTPFADTTPGNGLVLRASDGSRFAINALGNDWVVWSEQRDGFVGQRGVPESGPSGTQTLRVTSESAFALRLTGDVLAPTAAVLVEGEGTDDMQETPLETVDGSALVGLEIQQLHVPVRVWRRAGVSGDRPYVDGQEGGEPGQVVILGPAWGGSDADLRLFYGTELPLSERAVESVSRLAGPESDLVVEFWIADTLTRFDQSDNDSLTSGDDIRSLPARSTTPRALAELSFSCDPSIEHDFVSATVDPDPLPPEACVGAAEHDVSIYPQVVDEEGSGNETSIDFSGEVLEVGLSVPADASIDCDQIGADLCSQNFIRFDQDGVDFWLLVGSPTYVSPVGVGETVRVQGVWSQGSFGGPHWDIALYTDTGLRAWFHRGSGAWAELEGLQLQRGTEQCLHDQFECTYDASQFALAAKLPGAKPIEIPMGESRVIGSWSVNNLAFEVGLGGDVPGCFDAPDGDVQFIVLPAP